MAYVNMQDIADQRKLSSKNFSSNDLFMMVEHGICAWNRSCVDT